MGVIVVVVVVVWHSMKTKASLSRLARSLHTATSADGAAAVAGVPPLAPLSLSAPPAAAAAVVRVTRFLAAPLASESLASTSSKTDARGGNKDAAEEEPDESPSVAEEELEAGVEALSHAVHSGPVMHAFAAAANDPWPPLAADRPLKGAIASSAHHDAADASSCSG